MRRTNTVRPQDKLPSPAGSARLMEEPPQAEHHLNSVDAGIRRTQAGIGDVQVAYCNKRVPMTPEELHAKRGPGSEIDVGGSGRHLLSGEQQATVNFHVGRPAAVALEIPLQNNRINAGAKGIVALQDERAWHRIHGILEAAAQRARTMRIREHPTIAQAEAENAGVASASVGAASAAGEK